jgi:hypothetical protein
MARRAADRCRLQLVAVAFSCWCVARSAGAEQIWILGRELWPVVLAVLGADLVPARSFICNKPCRFHKGCVVIGRSHQIACLSLLCLENVTVKFTYFSQVLLPKRRWILMSFIKWACVPTSQVRISLPRSYIYDLKLKVLPSNYYW